VDVKTPRWGGWARTTLLVLVLASIAAAYVFFLTAGHGTLLPERRHYHNMLADGFLQGHLHLSASPSPELLKQPDPYDVKTSSRHWIWDTVLYDGKYYLYFAPLPAILITGIKMVFGRDLVVQDQHLVLAFVIGRLFVGATLLALIRRWLFPASSPWVLVPAFLVFGLANPTLYQLGRPGVYEASIDSAQFFLLTGLLAGFIAVRGCSTRSREMVLLGVAGCCWAAALGCRIGLPFAAGALVLITAVLGTPRTGQTFRSVLLRLVVAGAPVATVVVGLLVYNYVRFDSFTEFGNTYQLTGRRYHATPQLILPNLHAYLLRRFTVSCEFPFLGAPYFAKALTPSWVTPDLGYSPKEPTVGLLVAVPYALFALAAVALASWRLRVVRGWNDGDRLLVWIVACCTAIAVLAGIPDLGVWFSTMRYLTDVTPAILILATIGVWMLLARRCSSRPAVLAVRAAVATITLYTVGVGVLLGFLGGYGQAIRKRNAPLHSTLVKTLSLCPPSAPVSEPRAR
jgi:hypothetical protein